MTASREQVIAKLEEWKTLFMRGSVAALYYAILSLRHGTAESTFYFWESVGRFGVIAFVCSEVKKHLQETSLNPAAATNLQPTPKEKGPAD
jgi:hypothetical protein